MISFTQTHRFNKFYCHDYSILYKSSVFMKTYLRGPGKIIVQNQKRSKWFEQRLKTSVIFILLY